MEESWRESLIRGGMILTVNRRLARVLHEAFARAMVTQGAVFWSTPRILPLKAWLEESWNLLLDQAEQLWPEGAPPLLLKEAHEAWLWEEVVVAAPGGRALLCPSEAARAAAEAARLLTEHGLDLLPRDVVDHEDGAAFLAWWQRVRQRCERQGWIGAGAWIDQLLPRLTNLALPSWIGLAGFDQFTPGLERLLETLQQAGCAVERLPMPRRSGRAQVLPCRDREEECRLAARWARQRLESGEVRSVGIVAVNLGQVREALLRHLGEVFQPGGPLRGGEAVASPFEVSVGTPLSEFPPVADGLRLLAMILGENLEPPRYGALLLSPYWGEKKGASHLFAQEESDDQSLHRARLDARLRQEGIFALRGAELAREANRDALPCGALLAKLLGRHGLPEDARGRAFPGVWAERFGRWLHALEWPGRRTLDSAEHQGVEAWREVLAEFAALGAVSGPMEADAALDRLRRLTRERMFQPEGRTDAPVRVMGVLEAAGLSFDALWILGMTDGAWPPVPSPNPFIPLHVQRRHGLPRATAVGELALAEQITRRLLDASPRIVASHPLLEGDQPLRISPLLDHLPPLGIGALQRPDIPDYDAMIQSAARLEQGWDDRAPPHAAGYAEGGTQLLRAQSHCPFQGFARHRLHARGLDDPQPGLTPLERGILVHDALARFWARAGGLAGLLALGEGVEGEIAAVVEATLTDGVKRWPKRFTPVTRELEQRRLERRLSAWLGQEEKRTPFEVTERESERRWAIAGLELKVRLDRMDRLADGARVILDYKTGGEKLALTHLLGDRPREPQLAVYALLEEPEPVVGVAFAKVRPTEMGFEGVAARPGVLPGVALPGERRLADVPEWNDLIARWRVALAGVATSWLDGVATVDPLRGVCTYCDLAALCRIGEMGGWGEEDETETGEGGNDAS